MEGEVVPFIRNMPEAFANADLVVGRAGAGAVNEIAAAGMASVLVPLPFAADDHQRRNAEVLVNADAARMVLDREMNGATIVPRNGELAAESRGTGSECERASSPVCETRSGRTCGGDTGRGCDREEKLEESIKDRFAH